MEATRGTEQVNRDYFSSVHCPQTILTQSSESPAQVIIKSENEGELSLRDSDSEGQPQVTPESDVVSIFSLLSPRRGLQTSEVTV